MSQPLDTPRRKSAMDVGEIYFWTATINGWKHLYNFGYIEIWYVRTLTRAKEIQGMGIKKHKINNIFKMKTVYRIILSMCLLSCSTNDKTEKANVAGKNIYTTGNAIDTTKASPLIKEIRQLIEDTCSVHWYGGGLFSLCFDKNKVSFFFTPQCIYWYKTKLENNKLIFFWDYNADCVFDRGLRRGYGVQNQPVVGSPFGEIVLVNDTTLRVKYYYANWVKKINEHEKDVDTLFPIIFKMKRK